ncbi:MAG TPA: stage II sporulation protein M [Thermoanaerobaculia bacterium]|nr:stage II sporulation protein M [Thermoanaerobaculia bacterium]
MNIERFVSDRTPVWQRLDELLTEAEASTPTPRELHEIVELYRRTASDLNRARSHTANPEILSYLNQLTGRGYRYIYRTSHEERVLPAFGRLVTRDIPAAYRRRRNAIVVAASVFLLGVFFGALAVAADRDNAPRLVPREFFTKSPRQRVEQIENGDERIDSMEKAALFGASLYTHNIKVACLAFGVGALTIVGGLWLLFYNGVILGAIGMLYLLDGVTVFFFAWVGPHGALELPSIIFAGAAGLLTGRALLMPGNLTRGASLRRVMPDVMRIMAGATLALICAGLIEGSFSQFSSHTIPYGLKIAVAALLFAGLLAYLFLRRMSESASGSAYD